MRLFVLLRPEIGEKYISRQLSFSGRVVPDVLQTALRLLKKQWGEKAILDVGCGDGALMEALVKNFKVVEHASLVGVDLSLENCRVAQTRVPQAKVVRADATSLPFDSETFDLVYSWMVIEHVENQEQMVAEGWRVLKRRGLFVIGTILRKQIAVYFHRKDGKFVLDPTHVREYRSPVELTSLLGEFGFGIQEIKTSPRFYPLIELILQGLAKLQFLSSTLDLRNIFLRYPFMDWLRRRIRIPIPGYFQLEILAVKEKSSLQKSRASGK